MPEGNVSLLGFDAADLFPHAPTAGATPEETMANIMDFFPKFQAALQEFAAIVNTRALMGFQSMTDGTNTYLASEGGTLTLAEGGDTTIAVDEATGTMTFTSTTGGGSATYVANGDSPPATPAEDDTWYVTADDGSYVKGRTYVYDGADWVEVGNLIYSTTITAGQISLTHTSVDSGNWTGTVGSETAAHVADGSGRALDGLNVSGYVTQPLRSTDMSSHSPSLDGLYMTADYLGFYDWGVGWMAYITDGGDFYFRGDPDNYLQWNATTAVLDLKFKDGYLGSTTDYFDITNSILCLRQSDSQYAKLYSQGLVLTTGANGAGTAHARYTRTDCYLRRQSSGYVQMTVSGYDGSVAFSAYVNSSDEGQILIQGDTTHYLRCYKNTTTYELKGFALKSCTYESSDASAGVSGTFDDTDSNTVTVKDGIITDLTT